MKKNREKSVISINILIGLFFIVSVLFPVISLISKVDFSNFGAIVGSVQFKSALTNSIVVTLCSTIISVLIAYVLAYAINRSNIKHKALLTVLLTIPMLIPSISHGIGLINLFGTNGLVNRLLGTSISIYGFSGIVVGSVMYSFPVAFLMLSDAFKYVDNSMYETSQVLGLNNFQTFRKVTFYYLKKPILSVLFAVFTMIFTDYGVPLAIGARYETLPVFLYREVIGLLDFNKGTIIGMFLLIPAVFSFIFDLLNKENGNSSFTNKEYIINKNKVKDRLLAIFTYIILSFEIIVLLSFVIIAFTNKYPYDMSFSFVHIKYVFQGVALRSLKNSLIIAFISGLVGTIIAYFTAYLTARIKNKLSKVIHILAICSLAIPGIVLGISYCLAFNNTFIYNTIIVLIIVNIIHFFASPYLLAYNALGKLNQNFEIVGTSCGVGRFRIIKDVIIPNTKETILEMFSYIFVNAMITISAVAFLFNTKTMPISLLINQYEGQLMMEEVAVVSLIILFINLLVKGVVYFYRKINYKRSIICN